MVVWLFLAEPCVCLRFVIVVFTDHTHLLFLYDAQVEKDVFLYLPKMMSDFLSANAIVL